MPNYYCKYCGWKASNVRSLTSCRCSKHPDGGNKGYHALYEGDEKREYTCKNCGRKYTSITSLTSNVCARHPDGGNKGWHQPTL